MARPLVRRRNIHREASLALTGVNRATVHHQGHLLNTADTSPLKVDTSPPKVDIRHLRVDTKLPRQEDTDLPKDLLAEIADINPATRRPICRQPKSRTTAPISKDPGTKIVNSTSSTRSVTERRRLCLYVDVVHHPKSCRVNPSIHTDRNQLLQAKRRVERVYQRRTKRQALPLRQVHLKLTVSGPVTEYRCREMGLQER